MKQKYHIIPLRSKIVSNLLYLFFVNAASSSKDLAQANVCGGIVSDKNFLVVSEKALWWFKYFIQTNPQSWKIF